MKEKSCESRLFLGYWCLRCICHVRGRSLKRVRGKRENVSREVGQIDETRQEEAGDQ